ncbi:MAG: alpha-galactosidase [Actinomycetota bacterium]
MLHSLSSPRLEMVVDDAAGGLETVWLGAPITAVEPAAFQAPVPEAGTDRLAPLSVLAEAGAGWGGRPGIAAQRAGPAVFPRLGPSIVHVDGGTLRAVADDPATGIAVTIEARLDEAGVLVLQAEIENLGEPLTVDEVLLTVPCPHGVEIMQLSGRWSDEFHPTRTAWEWGAVAVENRSGRTSHTRFPMLFAGSAGFAEERGTVTAVHLGWSGNGQVRAERLPDGRRVLQAGELLLPGEVILDREETYRTPPVYVVHSTVGLNGVSDAFHEHLRARPQHPAGTRPVLLNTWEAVYFHHDLATVTALADRAAEVGVERFVLDDGWFVGRNDDTSALGDWVVDPEKWPNGLGPLIDHVTSLGMEFGLWVEPEMVNPDSDLYRAHPDWVLADPHHEPLLARDQLVVDLTNPDAYTHVRDGMLALLDEYAIAYLKWDMNRDHVAPVAADGRAGTHRQTLAAYALIDELRTAHPGVEIESCASGGARIDLGILERTDRIWTSDCNDALDRVRIQRGVSYLVPPELMGAHVGPTRSHTTGRTHPVAFRGATALFGHLGVEWNLLDATDRERSQLARVIELHKAHRHLLHSGRTLRIDTDDPSLSAFAVVATDASEAIVSISQVATTRGLPAGVVRIPGLIDDRPYRVERITLDAGPLGKAKQQPAWLDGVDACGDQLRVAGLTLPVLNPETALLLHLRAH